MTQIWHVYFSDDGNGWSSFHTTEESARLLYVEQMVSIILEHAEETDEDALRALSTDDLHGRYEEVTDQSGCFEEVSLLTLTNAAEAKVEVAT